MKKNKDNFGYKEIYSNKIAGWKIFISRKKFRNQKGILSPIVGYSMESNWKIILKCRKKNGF